MILRALGLTALIIGIKVYEDIFPAPVLFLTVPASIGISYVALVRAANRVTIRIDGGCLTSVVGPLWNPFERPVELDTQIIVDVEVEKYGEYRNPLQLYRCIAKTADESITIASRLSAPNSNTLQEELRERLALPRSEPQSSDPR